MIANAPLHRAATFVPPLSDRKNYQDDQGSPWPRKFCFCVTAAARPFCVPWATKTAIHSGTTGRVRAAEWMQSHRHAGSRVAVVAEWRHSGHHSVRSLDAIGRPKEAQYSGTRSEAEASLKLMFTHGTHFYGSTNGRPLCIHPTTKVMDVPSSCLLWATCEWPTSSVSFVRLVLNMLKTSRRPWRPWRGLHVLCAAIERPKQPFGLRCLRRRPGWFCGRTREVQRAQPLCKGGIGIYSKQRCWIWGRDVNWT